MKKLLPLFLPFSFLAGCASPPQTFLGDSAVRRVDDCTCYASIDAQVQKPWEIAWDDPAELRRQISHCVCRAHIDISNVENPRRYLVPGTVVQ